MPDADAATHSTWPTQLRQFPLAFWTLLALTAAVRLPAIARPLLGNFATKSVVYAMIARNWAEGRASFWNPTVDVLCGDSRGWHLVEFPVSAYLTGWLWAVLGGSLDVWGRVTSVAFCVGSVALMYLFVRRREGPATAVAAATALALSPVSIIYGQSFMLEASLVFFTMATFYAHDRWLDRRRTAWLILACVCLALLFLTKIYMIVLLLPLGWMAVRNRRVGWLAAAGLAILPAAVWYAYAYQAASPDGPHAERIYFSLRRSTQDHWPPPPLLYSADFYRQLLDDLSGVVLTPIGVALLLAGLMNRRWRSYLPWLAAMAILLLALPRKFYEMNYYALVVLPPLCVMIGLGWQTIYARVRPSRTAIAVLLSAVMIFSLRYAARPAFFTPSEDRGVLAAAEAVRKLTDVDEPIVTVHGSTIDLLYYCNRPGWAVAPDTPDLDAVLQSYRRQGARYVVVVGRDPMLREPLVSGENFRVYGIEGKGLRVRD